MTDQPAAEGEPVVLYEVREGIAVVTLNRPSCLNAWTDPLQYQLRDAMDRAQADDDVRVIILTGAGKAFCAGGDMDLLEEYTKNPTLDPIGVLQAYFPLIPKPVIAAVNGACAGIGFVLATMCDLRFAGHSAKFSTAFARRGLTAESGLPWYLPRIIGTARAFDLLFSGRTFKGDEAYELGVVNAVVADDELQSHVFDYARQLATLSSPYAMAQMKQQVYRSLQQGLWSSIDEGNAWAVGSLHYGDFTEGVQSYLEKRRPAFDPYVGDKLPILADTGTENLPEPYIATAPRSRDAASGPASG